MTTGHLVTGLDSTLDCQVNLDDLQHAWRQVIALGQLVLLVFETLIQINATFLELCLGTLKLLIHGLIGHAQFEPVIPGQAFQIVLGDLLTFLDLRSTGGNLAQ